MIGVKVIKRRKNCFSSYVFIRSKYKVIYYWWRWWIVLRKL